MTDKQPPAARPVATLYVGSEWGQELQDWEIEANQNVCERLNEQYVGNPTTLTLYPRPDPRIAEYRALLRDALGAFAGDFEINPRDVRDRIAAALKEGA